MSEIEVGNKSASRALGRPKDRYEAIDILRRKGHQDQSGRAAPSMGSLHLYVFTQPRPEADSLAAPMGKLRPTDIRSGGKRR